MIRLPKIAIVAALCLVVVGCESKCDNIPFLGQQDVDIKNDPTLGPVADAVTGGTPDVEKLAVIALLLAETGRMSAADAGNAFDNDVASLAAGNVDSQKIAQVLDATVDAYVSVVEAKARAATAWPASRAASVWRIAAALQIAVARKEIAAARAANGEIPFTALRQLNRVIGWTRGEDEPSNDPLAGYDDMVERGVTVLSSGTVSLQE